MSSFFGIFRIVALKGRWIGNYINSMKECFRVEVDDVVRGNVKVGRDGDEDGQVR